MSADPRRCEECGADISHKRSIARFCSTACSARARYQDPENRKRDLALKQTRRQRPGVMERELAQQAAYRARPARPSGLTGHAKKAEREAREQGEGAETGETR